MVLPVLVVTHDAQKQLTQQSNEKGEYMGWWKDGQRLFNL